MDEELKQFAALALRNAFYTDFSGLVNKYLEASKGLDIDQQEMLMSETVGVYNRDIKANSNRSLNIWTRNSESERALDITEHETIISALEDKTATSVYLRNEKMFERQNGDWFFILIKKEF